MAARGGPCSVRPQTADATSGQPVELREERAHQTKAVHVELSHPRNWHSMVNAQLVKIGKRRGRLRYLALSPGEISLLAAAHLTNTHARKQHVSDCQMHTHQPSRHRTAFRLSPLLPPGFDTRASASPQPRSRITSTTAMYAALPGCPDAPSLLAL